MAYLPTLGNIVRRRRRGKPQGEPARASMPFPSLVTLGQIQTSGNRIAYRPTARNLRYFSRTPLARRAINSIKNPIANLEWEIVPMDGVKSSRLLDGQIETATYCFNNPNHDDNFRTFIEQITEDYLVGAAAFEIQISSDPLRPLWMFPTDGLTIQMYPDWVPTSRSPRYLQTTGYGSYAGGTRGIPLFDEEFAYCRPNPATDGPFGYGKLEVAFNDISRALSVADFAGNVSGNARPSSLLDLGDGANAEKISEFRKYWIDEVEGQGVMPIVAMGSASGAGDKTRGVSVLRLYPEGDKALYLEYQEFLNRQIACSFDISPQNLGIEHDVNRSTAEEASDRDRETAVKPDAGMLAEIMTRKALHGKLGFHQLRFRFRGLDREDEVRTAKIYEIYYKNNAMTPNAWRAKIGEPAMDLQWGDMLYVDTKIAEMAARGTATIEDTDLPSGYEPEKENVGAKPSGAS